MNRGMSETLNALILVKGNERYAFTYCDVDSKEVIRAFGRFAANPELGFTWYDAAVLSQKVMETSNG